MEIEGRKFGYLHNVSPDVAALFYFSVLFLITQLCLPEYYLVQPTN